MHKHSPSWYVLSSKATADIGLDALVPTVILTILALFIVMLRWYSRIAMSSKGRLEVEDYLAALATALSVAFTVLVGVECNIYGGRMRNMEKHMAPLTLTLKLVFAQSLIYHFAISLVKTSFLLQYIRVFSLVRPVVYTCYILLFCTLGAFGWGIFGVIFLCKPVDMYWNFLTTGTCMDAENHFWSSSIMGILLDFAIWLLPIPVVSKLKLPTRQKIGLLGVFSLGAFVCVVSVLRLVLVHDAAHADQMTKSGTLALIFSSVEINVVLICASLLVMKPLFARFLPRLLYSLSTTSAEEHRRVLSRTATRLALWEVMPEIHAMENAMIKAEMEEMKRRDTAIGMRTGSVLHTINETDEPL